MHCKPLMLLGLCTLVAYAEPALQATVVGEPDHVAGPVSPLLYGPFAEFMFEDSWQFQRLGPSVCVEAPQFKLSSPKFTLPPQSVSVLKVVRK